MRSIVFLFAVLFVTPSEARAPRATVEAVADAIAEHYFDAGRGAGIARELRAESAAGHYDDQTTPLDLAATLTRRLASRDRHFRVRWSPVRETGIDAAPARRPDSPRRSGVRGVRVLPGNIGYLDLAVFDDFDFADRQAPARVAVDAALTLLRWTDAVIIDLRQNGGGSPAMVGYLASAFMPKGADIFNTFVSRAGRTSEAPREWHAAPRVDVPLMILVSGRTGSAAESFAYTLVNAGRAVLVGERTAGAANPGGPVDVGAGFNVFVSNGSPVNPITKRNWERDGVTPTIAAPAREALRVAEIHVLETLLAKRADGAPDTLRWVLEAYRASTRDASGSPALTGVYGEVRIEIDEGVPVLHHRRRPPRALHALTDDTYYLDDDPLNRVVFERDAAGAIVALELRSAEGARSRFRKGS